MSPHRGSQDAMEPQQMEAGGGNEHAEFLDELQRIKQQVRGAIPAGEGQLVEELAAGTLRQPVRCQGRAPQYSRFLPGTAPPHAAPQIYGTRPPAAGKTNGSAASPATGPSPWPRPARTWPRSSA